MSFTCSQTFPFWAMWYYIVHSKCMSNIRTNAYYTQTNKQTSKHRKKRQQWASERFCFFSPFCFFTFYLSKYISACTYTGYAQNSHLFYLSIHLSVYLFICVSVKTTAKVAHSTHTEQEQILKPKIVKEKAISYDRYLFCVLSNHIRLLCVYYSLHAWVYVKTHTHSITYCVICSLGSICSVRMNSTEYECIFYFVIPFMLA